MTISPTFWAGKYMCLVNNKFELTLFALRNFEYSISIVFICEDNAPCNSATFFCSC